MAKRPATRRPKRSAKSPKTDGKGHALLRAANRHDAASIDALFDAFARNLARTLSHRSAGSTKQKGEGTP